MVGWHHQLNGHEFAQAQGDGEGQESLACCSPWGRKGSDTTGRLSNNSNFGSFLTLSSRHIIYYHIRDSWGNCTMV